MLKVNMLNGFYWFFPDRMKVRRAWEKEHEGQNPHACIEPELTCIVEVREGDIYQIQSDFSYNDWVDLGIFIGPLAACRCGWTGVEDETITGFCPKCADTTTYFEIE